MKVGVAIPFGGGDSRRQLLFDYVSRRWSALLPDAEIAVGDGGDPFNRSAGRNDAVRQLDSCDVVLVVDADTCIPALQVEFALDVVTWGRWGYLFDVYYNLTEEATEPILADPLFELQTIRDRDFHHRIVNSPSANIVCMREDYWEAGGFDARFGAAWGWDDNAARLAFTLVHGEPFRTPGFALHLWHDPGDGFSSPGIARNYKLYEEYKAQTPVSIRGYLRAQR